MAKYDASGSLIWARRAGGSSNDDSYGIAVDNGGVYITGTFWGTPNFNTPSSPASNTLTSAGTIDIFVAKYDASGSLVWARRAGGIGGDYGIGIAVNNSEVYVTGAFMGTANFNTPSSPASNTLTSAGAEDIFVAKYDASGNLIWARRAGANSVNNSGSGIAVDNSGVYITGYFNGTADFNTPSSPASNTLASAGATDIFVAKYDASGSLVWARRAGGSSNNDFGNGIAVDNGEVYVTGSISGIANFNTPSSPASNTLTVAGSFDIFVAKYDASGNLVWARRAGGSNIDSGSGIAVNNSGVYVTGAFQGTTDFNTPSSPASNTLTSAGAMTSSSANGSLLPLPLSRALRPRLPPSAWAVQ
ncbi:hypothetical protein GO730_34770 [Spirosoma sp. HMF3257]|uniref:SBBP repeat-containing protein n=1 Tax=Spirosoma telluris TaxID=2183553 RepID=A0A327NRQ8_9BACT|nr:hypothetical protein [Spirosoma telluris]RAI77962.1 hypothetical protein HMF3257_34670 [Spirosoma telluris]